MSIGEIAFEPQVGKVRMDLEEGFYPYWKAQGFVFTFVGHADGVVKPDFLKAHIEGEDGLGDGNKTSLHCVHVVGEREMNIPASNNDGHLLNWLAAVLLLVGFGLGDATIVAWSASIITFWQLVAVTFSFGLIAMGILITFWQMGR